MGSQMFRTTVMRGLALVLVVVAAGRIAPVARRAAIACRRGDVDV